MGELGPESERLHRQVGEAARAAGVSHLLATGPMSKHTVDAFGAEGSWFESIDALVNELRRTLTGGVNVLVKGSRSSRMERVVRAVQVEPTSRRRA
jgi:UDP-N-acetylmuramoyl-tripeptide--D-alanyl-D-alanine ligase